MAPVTALVLLLLGVVVLIAELLVLALFSEKMLVVSSTRSSRYSCSSALLFA